VRKGRRIGGAVEEALGMDIGHPWNFQENITAK